MGVKQGRGVYVKSLRLQCRVCWRREESYAKQWMLHHGKQCHFLHQTIAFCESDVWTKFVSKHKPIFPDLDPHNFPIFAIMHISLGLILNPLKILMPSRRKFISKTARKQKCLNVIRRQYTRSSSSLVAHSKINFA